MIAPAVAALALAAAPAICEDVPAERAALARMSSDTGDLAEVARALDERCAAPISSGVALDRSAGQVADALGLRLQAFCDAIARDAAGADLVVDRALLARIYARPEFARARAPDSGAVARLVEWLTALLESFFQTASAQSFAQGTRVLVLALALAAAGAAALRIASRRRVRASARSAVSAGAPGLELRPPAEHLTRASTALATDRRLAIREGLLALLAALERRSLARPDRVKTNREVAAELSQRGAPPPLADRATALLHWYDATYYSLEEPSLPDARRFVQDVTSLSAALLEVAG